MSRSREADAVAEGHSVGMINQRQALQAVEAMQQALEEQRLEQARNVSAPDL
ncbi:MAG: hypothetical protein AB7O04_05340 [Hyphomonadaceae bacterium]